MKWGGEIGNDGETTAIPSGSVLGLIVLGGKKYHDLSLSATTDEIGFRLRLQVMLGYCMLLSSTRLLSLMRLLFLFVSALALNMSTLDWRQGKWRPYGNDLETALQSQEARACSEWEFLLRRLSRRLSPLFDRLWLGSNQLTSLPNCVGQLTNLTLYGIQFVIWFQFS